MKFSVNFERDDHGEWTATMTECPRLVRHGFTIGTAAQKLFEMAHRRPAGNEATTRRWRNPSSSDHLTRLGHKGLR